MYLKDDKAFIEFKNEIARVFNEDTLWSCEYCYWVDADDRICEICHVISEALKRDEGRCGLR